MRFPVRFLFSLAALGSILVVFSGCSVQAKKGRHLARADQYYAGGDYDRAEIEYLNVLQIETMNPEAISGLAILYFDQGRTGRVYALLVKARELQPANLKIRTRLAKFDLALGQPADARAEAEYVMERMPLDPDAPILLAQAANTPAEITATRTRLQTLPTAAKDGAPVLAALALLELRDGQTARARAEVERALAADARSSTANQVLSQVCWAEKDASGTGAALTRAAELSPLRSAVRIQEVRFQLQAGHADIAAQKLAELTRQAPDFLPAWMLRAETAATARNYGESIGFVEKVLARDPLHPEAMLLQIRVLLANGQREQAVAAAERSVKIYPKGAQFQYQLGLAYAANGETARAAAILNQTVTQAPDYAEAVLALADLNRRQGNLDAASLGLKTLIGKRPELPQPRLLLAEVYRAQKRFGDALAVYQQFEAAFPGNPQTVLLSGLVLLQQGKKAEARQAFVRATEIAPGFLPAMEQLVNLDLAEKNYAAARARVEAVIAKDPKAAGPQLVLAKVFVAESDTKKAEATLLKVIELQPELPVPYVLLASLYIRLNQHEQALAKLTQASLRNPKDIDSLMMMAVIHEQRKNYAAAREQYEKILALNRRFSPALNNLAYLYSEQFGDVEKAYTLAQRARELLPYEPHTADTLGWILYRRHQYPWALSLLAESAERLPDSAAVQFHLGMTHYMMGEEPAARAALERALSLDAGFPNAGEARRCLGVLDLDPAKADSEALGRLQQLAKDAPDPVALSRLGALHARAGAVGPAIEAYEAALQLSGSNVPVAVALIRLYDSRHDTQKAFELAKAARKQAPADPTVAHLLGRLAYATGDHVWAASLLQESVQRLPDDGDVLYDYAQACYSTGNLAGAEAAAKSALTTSSAARARRFLELAALTTNAAKAAAATALVDQALKETPDNAPALMARAEGAAFRGEAKAALKGYEALLRQYPEFTPAMKELAILYARDPAAGDKAATIGAKAREAFPEDTELSRALGIVAFRQANYSRAASLLGESARVRADDPELLFYLGMSRIRLRQPGLGKPLLQRALELNVPTDLAVQARTTLSKADGKGE